MAENGSGLALLAGAFKLKLIAVIGVIGVLLSLLGIVFLGVIAGGAGGGSGGGTTAAASGGGCLALPGGATLTKTLNLDAPGAAPGFDGSGRVHPVTQYAAEAVVKKFGPMPVGGVRADSYKWHPLGLAADFMTYEDLAKGDAIVAFLIENATAFNLDDLLWRQRVWTPSKGWQPMEDRGSKTANHFDHVHMAIRENTPPDLALTPCSPDGVWAGDVTGPSPKGLPEGYVDDYPNKNMTPDVGSVAGGLSRECTDFVGWRLNQMLQAQGQPPSWFNGNAGEWWDKWGQRGWPRTKTPAVGAVAWFARGVTWSGSVGHVAIVREVFPDGTIGIEEYNVKKFAYSHQRVSAGYPSGYLYLPTFEKPSNAQ